MEIILMIALFIGASFFLGVVGVGALFFFKGSKKHEFLYYSLDGMNIKKILAKVKQDATNTQKTVFKFENGNELTQRNPTAFLNGKPFREVTQDDNGEYVYIKRGFDKTKYLALALMPEEKSIALNRYKENQKSYDTGTSKLQAAMVIGLFLLLLINIFASVYLVTQSYLKIDDINEISKETNKYAAAMKETTNIMVGVTEQQAQITAALTGDVNLTRRLT